MWNISKQKKVFMWMFFIFCYEKVIHDKNLIFHRVFDKLNSAVIMMIYIYIYELQYEIILTKSKSKGN